MTLSAKMITRGWGGRAAAVAAVACAVAACGSPPPGEGADEDADPEAGQVVGEVAAETQAETQAVKGAVGERVGVEVSDPWVSAYPMIRLANEHAAVLVAVPEAEGDAPLFNTASRFDRAGMIVHAATASGRTYFGPIVSPGDHDPTVDDHVAGTAGEFGMDSPLGYDEAGVGGEFVKVGVGVLRRLDGEPYFFRKPYPIVDAGQWEVERGEGRVVMTHTLTGPRGWGYVYQTTVQLSEDEAGWTLTRTLTNTGEQAIHTSHYCHNFFILDSEPVSPDYVVKLAPSHEVIEEKTVPATVTFDGETLAIPRPLEANNSVWVPMQPAAAGGEAAWSARVADASTGAGVTIRQSPVPDRVVLYIKSPYLSVEPFINLNIEPGESATWTATYQLE